MDKIYRIGITGSSGMIGSALTSFLEKKGHKAIPISLRNTIDPSSLESMDAVVNLSGENISSSRWTPAKKARIFDSRVKGTRELVAVLNQLTNPPKVLVSASAIGYYGNNPEGKCVESTPAGTDFLASVCKAWESEALKFKGRCVTPRFATVMTTKGGALAKILPIFKLGLGGKLGSGKQFMSWVALEDLLRVLYLLIEDERLEGPLNVCTPTPITNAELTHHLGHALHRPTCLPIPSFLLRWILGEMAQATLLASAYVIPKVLIDHKFNCHFPDLKKILEQ